MKNPCQKLHRYRGLQFLGAFYGGFEVPIFGDVIKLLRKECASVARLNAIMGGSGSSLLKCFGQMFYGHKEFRLLMIGEKMEFLLILGTIERGWPSIVL